MNNSAEGLSELIQWLLLGDLHRKTITQFRMRKLTRKFLGKETCLLSSFADLLILAVWVNQESGKHHLRNSDFQENDSQ